MRASGVLCRPPSFMRWIAQRMTRQRTAQREAATEPVEWMLRGAGLDEWIKASEGCPARPACTLPQEDR